MHPRTAEMLRHLEDSRAVLVRAFESVPSELRRVRPAHDAWSAAEVLDHLEQVGANVASLLAHLFEKARARGLMAESESSPVLPKFDAPAESVKDRRVEAPENVRPRAAAAGDDPWAGLERAHSALLGVVRSADGLAVGTIAARHPVLGRLDFHQWVAFVGFHEVRHAGQIDAIVAALRG